MPVHPRGAGFQPTVPPRNHFRSARTRPAKLALTPITNVIIYTRNQYTEPFAMPDVSISDAEWQVMNIVWEAQPLAAQEVVARLQASTDWAPPTIKTMLHRLVKKRVLSYERQGNRYVYSSRTK